MSLWRPLLAFHGSKCQPFDGSSVRNRGGDCPCVVDSFFRSQAQEDIETRRRIDKRVRVSELNACWPTSGAYPFTGIKSEPNRHQVCGILSRRITGEHRLVYKNPAILSLLHSAGSTTSKISSALLGSGAAPANSASTPSPAASPAPPRRPGRAQRCTPGKAGEGVAQQK